MKSVLHVGCSGHPLPYFFEGSDETRLDIDPACNPDIIASMCGMGDIGLFDLIYCSHALEHLYPHEVPVALKEFIRVLEPGGAAVVLVPDLEDVKATNELLYGTAAQGITGLDLIYGLSTTIEASLYWAHHTGFVSETLGAAMTTAGFSKTIIKRLPLHNLLAVGIK